MEQTMDKMAMQAVNWSAVQDKMHEKGYAGIPGFLTKEQCSELIGLYDQNTRFRKTIAMERYRFGQGEYKYFNYPLPSLIHELREAIYPHLAQIANLWMKALKVDISFPDTLQQLLELCRQNNQSRPTPLILKYGRGGYNTLHQDLYGEVFFPMQAVLFLNEYGRDYTGGEFVLTEQRPRAQSKAIVLKPGPGDLLIFTTRFRPVKGTKGYYRVSMRHGVSEVEHGERYAVGIIFHDAA